MPFDGFGKLVNPYAIFAYEMVKSETIFNELYLLSKILQLEELTRLLIVKKSSDTFWRKSLHPLALKVRFLDKKMVTKSLII